MFNCKYKECAVFKYENALFLNTKNVLLSTTKSSLFLNTKDALLSNTKYVLFFKYRKCMLFLQIYKYGKSIYDLKQKNLLISDTKNMLILNTNVTFKYECYLFW